MTTQRPTPPDDDERRNRRPPPPEEGREGRESRLTPTPRVAATGTYSSGARYDATLNAYVRSDAGGTFAYTSDGTLPIATGVHRIMKTSAAALTLAAPAASDEGCLMIITAGTAFAHIVTIAEGVGGKGGNFDQIAFAAVGDTISLRATNAHWVPEGAPYGAVIS